MKQLFITVFALTIADAACTAAGICKGIIEEANPLLQAAITSMPIVTSGAVCALVGVLLWGLYRIRYRVRFMAPLILAVFAVKFAVLSMHAYWIVLAI